VESLFVEATKSSPYVHFDPRLHVLEIKGESYPENAAKFYAPMFAWLEKYLASVDNDQSIEVNMEIVYFNSSSSKVFMNFFELLQDAAVAGKNVVVNWKCHEDNETALECGEEFMEDLEDLTFNIIIIEVPGD
jgi:hypothetical protein